MSRQASSWPQLKKTQAELEERQLERKMEPIPNQDQARESRYRIEPEVAWKLLLPGRG